MPGLVRRLTCFVASVAVVGAAIVLAINAPGASGAVRQSFCNQPIGGGALGGAGIRERSGRRYDGLEVEVTPQRAPHGLVGCETIRAVLYLGEASRYVSIEIGAHATDRAYRPAAFWVTAGEGHLAPVTLPGEPWPPRTRHLLRILHVGATNNWLLAFDGQAVGAVRVGGSSGGLPLPRVFAVTTNYDDRSNLADFKFTHLRALEARASEWSRLKSASLYSFGTGYQARTIAADGFVVSNN